MKCVKNKCKHYINDVWCEVFEEITDGMNCFGAFEPKENMEDKE